MYSLTLYAIYSSILKKSYKYNKIKINNRLEAELYNNTTVNILFKLVYKKVQYRKCDVC